MITDVVEVEKNVETETDYAEIATRLVSAENEEQVRDALKEFSTAEKYLFLGILKLRVEKGICVKVVRE